MLTVSSIENKKRSLSQMQDQHLFGAFKTAKMDKETELNSFKRLLLKATHSSHYHVVDMIWENIKEENQIDVADFILNKLLTTTYNERESCVADDDRDSHQIASEMVKTWMNVLKKVSDEYMYLQKASSYADVYFKNGINHAIPFACFLPDEKTKAYWKANKTVSDADIMTQFRLSTTQNKEIDSYDETVHFFYVMEDLFFECSYPCSNNLFKDILSSVVNVSGEDFFRMFSSIISIKEKQQTKYGLIETLSFQFTFDLLVKISETDQKSWNLHLCTIKTHAILYPHYESGTYKDFSDIMKQPDSIKAVKIIYRMKTNMDVGDYEKQSRLIISNPHTTINTGLFVFDFTTNLSGFELNNLIIIYWKGSVLKQFLDKQTQMLHNS